MIMANTRKRSQAISIDGKVADRYFAVTSEVPRKIVESSISAMPLKGRSARAGAGLVSADLASGSGFAGGEGSGALSILATTAGFFWGCGKGALSSRATAAAGGGV